MIKISNSLVYKALAVVLCLFLSFEVHYILAYQTSEELNEVFNIAKEAYLKGDYIVAKGYLEFLKSTMAQVKREDTFAGRVYLLLGATYEKLQYYNTALKYYCMSKDILGEEASIEGVNLEYLKIFIIPCETKSGASISYIVSQFIKGLNDYNEGNYEGAKKTLELQLPAIKRLDGLDYLQGETYILLGAIYEKLNDRKFAKKYYTQGKELLGEVDMIEGIPLTNLRWYRWKSTDWAAVESQQKMKKGLTGLLGLILSIVFLSGLFAYLLLAQKEGPHQDVTGRDFHLGVYRPEILDLQGATEVETNSTHTYTAIANDPDSEKVTIRFWWEYTTSDGKRKEGYQDYTYASVNEWISHTITWTDAKSGSLGAVKANAYNKGQETTNPSSMGTWDKTLVITFK